MNKQAWMKRAAELGLEQFEIYQALASQKEFTWFEQTLDTFVTSKVLGTSLRAIKDGNVATIALEKVDDGKMDEALRALLEQTAIVSSEETVALTPVHEVVALENPHRFEPLSVEQIEAMLQAIEKKALAFDPRIVQVGYLGYEEAKGGREITNSLGVQLADEDAVQYVACTIVALENGEYKDATKVRIVYDAGFDVDAFVQEVCEEALGKLGAHSIPSRTCPVVFEKDAMTSLFGAFAGLFSGDMIAKGISPISKDLGKKIFSEQITIFDDPRHTDALSVAAFDDEGFPTRRKTVVDHGVFEQPLYDARSAAKMNVESTGNGFKSGYASPVRVSPMNMWIEPGTEDLDALLARMGDGLVITDLMGLRAGLHFASTQFSLQASGYLVKDGKRGDPVTLITVAGRFLDLMNEVEAVGSDLDWSYKQIASPSILFKQCAISGE